jgi:hypothetical protein
MGFFSLITAAALVVVAGMVVRLDRIRVGTQTALSAATSPAPEVVTDQATGLSYVVLGSGWHQGCPRALSTTEFHWTNGEAALAGTLGAGPGKGTAWYGNACSGPLPDRFRRLPRATAAWDLARAVEPVYYGALRHSVSAERSTALRVGGQPGWLAEFVVRYAGGQHLAWSSELAAVVVTKSAMFYVSVPDNLGTGAVAAVLSSLR